MVTGKAMHVVMLWSYDNALQYGLPMFVEFGNVS